MERLTMKAEDGYERVSIRTKNQQLIDKLAYYEDLEEQGRLIVSLVADVIVERRIEK